jgi:hypothetical protein
VSVEVGALDDDVSEIDANAKRNGAIVWLTRISVGHPLLEIHSALHGVDGATELDQNAIPRQLENATLMQSDQGLDYIFATGSQ